MIRYGILLPGRVLAFDHALGRPATYAHRRSAARAILRSMPDYLASYARVVRVTIQDSTYTVHA